MQGLLPSRADLSASQFTRISDLVSRRAGINLHQGKRELVVARLNKRLRQLSLPGFEEYLDVLAGPAGEAELAVMLDLLSTNVTQFFREPAHFEFLRTRIVPHLPAGRIRVWSAGCSTGEEPYSIAMVLADALGERIERDLRILATDLSGRVLGAAAAGKYPSARIKDVPPLFRSRFFEPCHGQEARATPTDAAWVVVRPAIRHLVTFARLNLVGDWPMRGPFDTIFCRNVMIYFDKPLQCDLVKRFWGLLRPGGCLFLGHSESLAGVDHPFEYVQPTIYRRGC